MNKKWGWALIVVPLGVFLAARQLASWRPQTISKAEFEARSELPVLLKAPAGDESGVSSEPQVIGHADFEARSSTPVARLDFDAENLTETAKRLKKLARAKGLDAKSLSPDGRRLLATNGLSYCKATLLSADDGRVLVRLAQPNPDYCDEGGALWSPDSLLVAFSQFEVSPTQVFDVQTGAHLWGGKYWGETFRFSPDSRFAALSDVNGEFLSVREARTGHEIRRLPLKQFFTDNWSFSRDSQYLLAKIAPDEFRQLRLR